MTAVRLGPGDLLPCDDEVRAAVAAALGGEPDVVVGLGVDRDGAVARSVVHVAVPGRPAAELGAALGPGLAAVLGATGDVPTAEAVGAWPEDTRLVRFPGQDEAHGDVRVADLVARTGIDEVVGIGLAPTPDDVVATAGFLRPVVRDGRHVLLVEPVGAGRFRPAEIERPHQCCGGH